MSISRQLKKFVGAPDWRFRLEEGSVMGRRVLVDREIEIDLNAFNELKGSPTVTTQVLACVSFARLLPIHARIEQVLPRQREVGEVFHVHERKAFLVRFSLNWRSELRDLLNQIEEWSAALDLDRAVSSFAANRPDGPSVPQINHLVGLVYLGDFTALGDYARTFEKGSRLNFVPMITREVIEAAEALSCDYFLERRSKAESGGSPKSGPASGCVP
jgi:hypothetical protein